MLEVLRPFDVLLICLAGWINERDHRINKYLSAENRVLKEQLGTRRLRLTDDQRRRLAVLGRSLGRKVLAEWASLVTPRRTNSAFGFTPHPSHHTMSSVTGS